MARVAIVTGAARGIGAATIAALAASGYEVLAADACADAPGVPYGLGTRVELEEVAVQAGPGTTAVVADATDLEAMTGLVARAEREHGGLDVIVAAAGVIAGGAPQWELAREQEQAVLDVCLNGVLVASRAAIPALLRRPERGRRVAPGRRRRR